jgi:hypothetical protein
VAHFGFSALVALMRNHLRREVYENSVITESKLSFNPGGAMW